MDNMLLPVSHTDLVASSYEAIDAIKTASGLTDAQFNGLCAPMIRAYAEQVQNLPLSGGAFGSPRGAWEFGLAASMVAYRYAGTVVFYPALGSEERRRLEPQCRYMAFLATLATAVAMVAESSVLTADDDTYHPLAVDGSLFKWLSTHQSPRFSWRSPAPALSPQAGAAIAAHFVPKRLFANFDLGPVMMMYEAVNPKTTLNGVESTLARVVREATQGVLTHYRKKQTGAFQVDVSQQKISSIETEQIAKQMSSVADTTIVANPLDKPAATQAPVDLHPTTPSLAPASATTSSHAHPQPASPRDAASAGINTSAAAPGSTAERPLVATAQDAQAKLQSGHKVLVEWFSALKQHPQFNLLKDELAMDENGIEVPVSMLGMFGVSGASIRKMMEEAGLILGRSKNARGVILHPGLRAHFISE